MLRKEFYTAKKSEDISKEINLLIIGGSQGAELFDIMIGETIVNLSKKYKLKVFQQTNLKNNQNLKKFYLKNNIENELFDFEESVSSFMSRSNICITRAGASTLAELIYLTVPHIAIPLPSARDNHQFENALFYKNLNCSWILNQNEFNPANLNDKMVNIIENKVDYLEKKRNMTLSVLKKQLNKVLEKKFNKNNVIVAYEPIWSIGTGKIPTVEELQTTTIHIKKVLKSIFKKHSPAVLYGGSVDEKNVEMFKHIEEIDGFLIGGASKSSNKFIEIIKNYYR